MLEGPRLNFLVKIIPFSRVRWFRVTRRPILMKNRVSVPLLKLPLFMSFSVHGGLGVFRKFLLPRSIFLLPSVLVSGSVRGTRRDRRTGPVVHFVPLPRLRFRFICPRVQPCLRLLLLKRRIPLRFTIRPSLWRPVGPTNASVWFRRWTLTFRRRRPFRW